jgi:hypothetical protein
MVSDDLIAANGERSFFLLMVARWGCIPFAWIGGIVCYLKGYLLSNEYSPKLFLRAHDPAVVPVALEIIGEAYKDRLDHWSTPDQEQSVKIVAAALSRQISMSRRLSR